MPATATSSPGPASSASTRSSASVTYSSVTFTRSMFPSARHQATCWPRRIVPSRTRQRARRPTYGDASRFVTCAWRGWPSSYDGAGIRSSRSSNSGRRSSASPSGSSPARPALAFAYTIGNSIWLSSASRSRKSSYTSFTTSSLRASGRSTLLTTRITGSRASSALRSTKRVCGSGPSLASTSSRTPSTMVSARSTSPPKSA